MHDDSSPLAPALSAFDKAIASEKERYRRNKERDYALAGIALTISLITFALGSPEGAYVFGATAVIMLGYGSHPSGVVDGLTLAQDLLDEKVSRLR